MSKTPATSGVMIPGWAQGTKESFARLLQLEELVNFSHYNAS